MDIRKIKKLIEMLQESDLKEIEVSQGDESVRILRDRFVQTNENKIIQQPEIFNSLHALVARSAISPLFAMRTLNAMTI